MPHESEFIGPAEAGRALLEALGLSGVKGVLGVQLKVEAGEMPVVVVTRHMTSEQAGLVCSLLKTWELDLVAKGPASERRIKADGLVGEAVTPPFPSFHPREG